MSATVHFQDMVFYTNLAQLFKGYLDMCSEIIFDEVVFSN